MKFTIYYKVNGLKTLWKYPCEYIEAESKEEAYGKCHDAIEDIVGRMWMDERHMTELVIKKKRKQNA